MVSLYYSDLFYLFFHISFVRLIVADSWYPLIENGESDDSSSIFLFYKNETSKVNNENAQPYSYHPIFLLFSTTL